MKRIVLFLLFMWILANGFVIHAQGFIHPGGLHTQEDFDRIKAQLLANEPSVVQGYENLKANGYSSSTVETWPVETIVRGGSSGQNYINAARGAAMAYQNALRWKISGDEAHAQRAIYILNRWARECKAVTGDTNQSLAAGLYGYEFANAAELMRDYPGWAAEDFKKFQEWMLTIWYPRCIDFLKRRHDTWPQGRPGHYWSNWGLCNVLGVMSIGILCDDVFIYNQGLSYYKYDLVGNYTGNQTPPIRNEGLTEFLGNLVPAVHADNRGPYGYLGQMQESGRDQGHALMALGLAVDICQMAWNQGDDLFSHMDNRLAAGIEFVAAYNSGTDNLPWTEYWYRDVRTADHNAWKQTDNNGGGRGERRSYWDRIIGHYEGIKGVTMNNSRLMRDVLGPDYGGSGGTSGGYDHLGFTTLTCTRPAVTQAEAPTPLKQSILYNNTTYEKGELSGVTRGAQVKLIPKLPDGETNTGNWLWDTGASSKDLTITVNESSLYRVTYTNSNGVKSTQLFSIAVTGDCTPDKLVPTITYKGLAFNDSIITIPPFSDLTLSVYALPGAAGGKYKWYDNSTNTSITLNNITSNNVYTVVYTNEGGAETVLNFQIEVLIIAPSLIINGGNVENTGKAYVTAGKTVELKPIIQSGKEGGTWLWNTGETTKDITLTNIQETKHLSAKYTHNDREYVLEFDIYVLPFENAWSYWTLDEGSGNIAADSWSGRDAEFIGETWMQNGIEQGGAKLGVSSYLKMPGDGFIYSLTDFTVSIWVKQNQAGNWARIWDFGRSTNNYMFLTSNSGSGSAVRFAIKNGGTEQQINCSHILENDRWTHIAVSKSGNTGIMYINGEEAGRNENMTISPSDLGYLTQNYIGKSQFDADALFNGTVDEIRIYNNALTINEIKDLVALSTPLKPQNLTGTGSPAVININWDALAGATFNIKRSTISGGPYTTIATGLTSNSYSDTNITDSVYYYLVYSEIDNIISLPSEELFVATFDLPAAIQNLSGTALSSNQIKLTWDASPASEYVTAYTIERATVSGGPFTEIASGLTATEYIDEGLTTFTNYYYKVYATNLVGNGTPSAELNLQTANWSVPGIPAGIKVQPGFNRITLKWNPAKDASAYNVKRAEISGGPYTTIASDISNTLFIDNTAINGTTYFYVISSSNPLYSSENSEEIEAMPLADAWSYYPLDETTGASAPDLWNSRNGVVHNNAVWTEGVLDGALQLKNGAYIQMPNGYVNSLTDFTIALWVKQESVGNWARIWDFGRGDKYYMFLTSNTGSGGKVRFAVKNNGGEQQINCNHVLANGKWTHITVTKSGNTGIMYINGVEAGRNNILTINPSHLGNLTQNYIGKSQFTADAYFNGTVDDIRIYSKALNAAEIANMVQFVSPDSPGQLTASIADDEIRLSWDLVPGAESYSVKRATTSGGSYTTVASGLMSNSYTDNSRVQGISYYYIVTASANDIESLPSNEVNAITRPLRPESVIALEWNEKIDLSWKAVSGAVNYKIKRSDSPEGVFIEVGSSNGCAFSDPNLVNGQRYYYVISALNNGGESDDSNIFIATSVEKPEYDIWSHSDVGAPGLTGNAGFKDDVLTMHGAGADIWGTSDGFHFMYQKMSGDIGIVAKIETLQNTHASAKGGVMIRQSLDANSINAMSAIIPGGNLEFGYRTSTGGSSTNTALSGSTVPQWIKLVRTGNVFKAYRSSDGLTWSQHSDSPTINMTGDVYVGTLALSHNTSVLTKVTYGTIAVASALPSISSSLTVTGELGDRFNYQITASENPYYFNATGLPTGLTINNETGEITGNPTECGVFNVTIDVMNPFGGDTANLEITIDTPGIPANFTASLVSGKVELSWDSIPGSIKKYTVKRSDVSGGPYTTIKTNLTTNIHIDETVTCGNYFYVVCASLNGIEGQGCGEAFITIEPESPENVIALGWNEKTNLSWEIVEWADYYKIKRSTVSGGPYTEIGITQGCNYEDTGVDNDQEYFYVITAVGSGIESSNSNESAATPVDKPEYESWLHGDIGFTNRLGNAGFENNMFTIYGCGADLDSNYDKFYYAYKKVNSDRIGIIAKIESLDSDKLKSTSSDNQAKAGVMIRETLDKNSKNAMAILTSSGDFQFGYRTNTSDNTTFSSLTDGLSSAPYWVKLTRVGNEFRSFRSSDGITWEEINVIANIDMSNDVYIGLASCAPNSSEQVKAVYNDILISTASPVISNLSATNGEVNKAFNYRIIAAGDPFYYDADGLPEGLHIDNQTGKITGIPVKKGEYGVTLKAGNALGEYTKEVMIYIYDYSMSIDNLSSGMWNIYPNPVKDKLTIDFGENQSSSKIIRIIDINGKVNITETLKNGENIHILDMAGLPAGTYFLVINQEDGEIRSQKIIKE